VPLRIRDTLFRAVPAKIGRDDAGLTL